LASGEAHGSGECGLSVVNGFAKGFSENARRDGARRSSKPSMTRVITNSKSKKGKESFVINFSIIGNKNTDI